MRCVDRQPAHRLGRVDDDERVVLTGRADDSSIGATSPVADWTALNATTSVRPSIASARRGAGRTGRRSRARPCTSHGNTIDVNSMSGTRTRAPSGSAVAEVRTSCDTVLPSATSSGAA